MKMSWKTKSLLVLALLVVSLGAGSVLNPGVGASNANIASADACCATHAPAKTTVVADSGRQDSESASAPKDEKEKADLAALQKKSYPIETCVVSGEKLGGDMGEPVDYFHNGRLVRFCCKGCVSKFEKDPAKYLAKLDSAVIEKEKANYPLDTCVVSGEKLGGDMGEPIDYVVANRLVRLCCKGCIKDLEKDPAKYISKVDAARGGEKAAPRAPTAPASPAPKPSDDHSDHGGAHHH